MKKIEKKLYKKEKKRTLSKIFGTLKRPRLSVFRSHKHIYAQIIDDDAQRTLAFSSTLSPVVRKKTSSFSTKEAAFSVGESLALIALTKNIREVIFDRGKRPYHGRIKQLAEGARSAGLAF